MKWFMLLTKRNFKKPSFIFILLLIPIVTLAIALTTSIDPSVMHIGYTCDGSPEKSTKELFASLENDSGIISFKYYANEGLGQKAFDNGEIESLWIFPSDIEAETRKYYSGDKSAFIKVINRVQNEMTDASRNKLFCEIFPHVAYSLFENYVTLELPGGDNLSEEEILHYYTSRGIDTEIINVVTVDNSGEIYESEGNYITSPLRGIVAVIVLLSSLAAAMFTLSDIRRGLYALFPFGKRFALLLSSLFSHIIPASVTALVSIYLADLGEGLTDEIFRMVLFVTACASASLLLMGLFKTPKAFAVSVPIIILSAIIFSPVFINVTEFPVIQGIFPSYYYLYSFTNTYHTLYLALYTLTCGALSIPVLKKL